MDDATFCSRYLLLPRYNTALFIFRPGDSISNIRSLASALQFAIKEAWFYSHIRIRFKADETRCQLGWLHALIMRLRSGRILLPRRVPIFSTAVDMVSWPGDSASEPIRYESQPFLVILQQAITLGQGGQMIWG